MHPNRLFRVLQAPLAGALLSLGLLSAHAAPPAPAPAASAASAPDTRVQEHLTRLKTELKITPAQDKAWQAFSAQAVQRAQALRAQRAEAPPAPATGHAPERLAAQIERLQQHLAGLQSTQKSLKDLYAVLSAEQQDQADRALARLVHEGPMGHDGDRGGRRGPGHGPH